MAAVFTLRKVLVGVEMCGGFKRRPEAAIDSVSRSQEFWKQLAHFVVTRDYSVLTDMQASKTSKVAG
jgi:hypothetical protein